MLSDADREAIRQGQEILQRKRAEFSFNHPTPERPEPYKSPFKQTDPDIKTGDDRSTPRRVETIVASSDIKIWPTLLLAATKDNRRGDGDSHHSGAARLWFIARQLDRKGAGWIYKADLWAVLAGLEVGDRKRRRWIADALDLGLLVKSKIKGVYTLAGLARGAILLGCNKAETPAIIPIGDLVQPGWKARCWAAYLATTRNRPISQNVKESITGISPRTQRNLQAAAPGITARKNYAQTQLRGDHLTGLQEHGRPGAFVGAGNRVVFRLPDAHYVPAFYAQLAHRGRSRKAQKIINHLSTEGQVKGNFLKLFHERLNSARAVLRKLARSDIEQPGEVFVLRYAGRSSNIWDPIPA